MYDSAAVGAKASEAFEKCRRHEDTSGRGNSRNGAARIRSNAKGGIPRREKQKRKGRAALWFARIAAVSRIEAQRQKYM